MYKDLSQWRDIRNFVLRDKCSKRQVMRDTGVSWGTLTKMLATPFPPKHKGKGTVVSQRSPRRAEKYPNNQQQTWREVLDLLAKANQYDTRIIIAAIASINPSRATSQDLATLRSKLRDIGPKSNMECDRYSRDPESHQWMLRVMQKTESPTKIRELIGNAPGLDTLVEKACNGTLWERNRALAVLARLRHISLRVTARFLHSDMKAMAQHWRIYSKEGVQSGDKC